MALRTEEVRALIECGQNLAPCAVALTRFRERNPSDLAVGKLSLAELDWRLSNTVALLHRLLENAELSALEIAEKLLDMELHAPEHPETAGCGAAGLPGTRPGPRDAGPECGRDDSNMSANLRGQRTRAVSRLIRKLRPFMVKAAEFFWQTVSADEPCEVVADIAETMKIRRIPKANPWILLWIGEPGRVVNALRC